jgi:hypothetical protein
MLICNLLQVLRIVVEATGMARRLCAPREVIVERVFKRYGSTSAAPQSTACNTMLPYCLQQCRCHGGGGVTRFTLAAHFKHYKCCYPVQDPA